MSHSEETKRKLSLRLKGKTYEELYGIQKSKEMKANFSGKNNLDKLKKILEEIK